MTQRRQDSSLFSQWTFSYLNPLLLMGKSRELTAADFAPIETADGSMLLAQKIMAEWNANPHLYSVLLKVFGWQYASAGIVFFAEFVVQLSQGFCLAKLLEWLASNDNNSSDGYYYAAVIALGAWLFSLFHHWEFFLTYRTGMQIRVGLIAAIYQKCLLLPSAGITSTGFIVNLVSSDVERFQDLAIFLHYLWVAPLQIIAYMTLIYYQIGWSMFAAIGVIFLLVPLQATFGILFKRFRKFTAMLSDERIKSLSDMILGILVVKLYAWEVPFIRKIISIRDNELKYIWKANIQKAVNETLFSSSTLLINLVTFTTFHLTGGTLTAAKVFSTIVYMNVLKLSMTTFVPKAFQFLTESSVSVRRIEKLLRTPEATETIDATALNNSNVVEIHNASFSWDSADKLGILRTINLNIQCGLFYIICGSVGSGKSSLIHAILNDMFLLSGTIKIGTQKVAYVSQTAWILSGTIKENILFGNEFDREKFEMVIRVCALERDMSLFPNGWDTQIGERGVTMSGGQKARVSLARAVYSDADMYLLDDPLAAVDTRVSRQIFQQCLVGILKTKTIILVTHQIQYLFQADQIIVMEKGSIVQQGSFSEIENSDSELAKTLADLQQNDTLVNEPDYDEPHSSVKNIEITEPLERKERVFEGRIPFKTYSDYLRKGSSMFVLLFLLLLLFSSQALNIIADFWLANWASQTSELQQDKKWLTVFALLAVGSLLTCALRALLFFRSCLTSSNAFFKEMVNAVFRSPISFFQRTPHGMTMNRFSKDLGLMDEMLPEVFFNLLQCAILTLSVLVVSAIVVPYVMVLYPFVFYIFLRIRNFYLQTSRQIKRIEAITRSPVYSKVPATLEGISTIRAFNAQKRFQTEFNNLQDDNTRIFFTFITSARWLGMRLDALVALLTTIILFVVIPLRDTIRLAPATLGLMISYLILMSGTLQWAVRQSTELENLMVSVERVQEYTQLPPEGSFETETNPDADWPQEGKVEFVDMSLSYPNANSPDSPGRLSLKNISIVFEKGQKVGIVGRTGAGKSSLLQALFRLFEPAPKRSVIIDGLYTSDLGLTVLRSKIAIIPQDPFCFKGTIRFNLDPFSAYSDEDLWRTLEAVELKSAIENEPKKLDATVEENGSNWSIGERQLMCLARAILKNARLIVMDEATSSIDIKTDQLIQKAIRTQGGLFQNSTVLCIAHRLTTVMDYDKILVLEEGRIVEYGSPLELLAKNMDQEDAWFKRMVQQTGVSQKD